MVVEGEPGIFPPGLRELWRWWKGRRKADSADPSVRGTEEPPEHREQVDG